MQLKVIYINSFPGYHKNIDIYKPGTDEFFLIGMGSFIAKEFIARNYPIRFELWRMDKRIESIMNKRINGIHCKIFPSKSKRIFGKKIGEYSSLIFKEFKKYRDKENVVFHFMPNHNLIFHYFAWIVRKRVVVSTQLGGPNPLWNFKYNRNILSFFFYLMEKYFFMKSYNNTITICKSEVDYYNKINASVAHMPLFGISREHIFNIQNRNECRIKLGLPKNKKIILQVGRATKQRGFEWILDIIDYYKNNPDYYLVFAGINKTDEYYDKLVSKGVHIAPYLHQTELPIYYNAADLLYFILPDKVDLAFGGTGYVPLESLLCGTPVVSTSFHHFPGDEIKEVARIPRSKDDAIRMIDELIRAQVSRKLCRQIVIKHFSWDNVLNKHWEIYNQ